MLTEKEFNILYFIFKNQIEMTQRLLSNKLDISLGEVNKLLIKLEENKYIYCENKKYSLTVDGKAILDNYKVKNAVILAAGMSTRFAPLSYEKPKGLFKVKGEVLIERQIEQLIEAGITDITVVVGYMKEKFFYLADKYKINLVVNEDYYRFNNPSSMMSVIDKFSNTYLCCSDNYLSENIFEPYVYEPSYSVIYSEGKTEEYCLTLNSKNKITEVTVGGENAWYMAGPAYFDKAFSKKFFEILRKEYEDSEIRTHIWENVYRKHIKELDLYAKKYESGIIFEFDSLEELKAFDKDYINNADSNILKNICGVLSCQIAEIENITPIKSGLTNTSFKFEVKGNPYVYRHPGVGTNQYISRESEAFSMRVASELGLDDTYIKMDEKEGWKLSKFVKNARELDYHKPEEVEKSLEMMRKLHNANIQSKFDFNIWEKTLEFIEKLKIIGKTDIEGFSDMFVMMEEVHKKIIDDKYAKKCLCHCDCYSPNFLLDDENKMFLIDWEYSGNDDPAYDIGTFICCSDYSFEEANGIIKQYLGYEPKKLEYAHFYGYVAEASYYWYVWALYQESRGNLIGNWLYMWFKNTKLFAAKTLEIIK